MCMVHRMATTILGLMGKAGSGKDTFASRLVDQHGFTRIAFADPLKAVALDIDPILDVPDFFGGHPMRLSELVDTLGWDAAKTFSAVRRLLQNLGLSVRRNVDSSTWLNAAAWRAHEVDGPVVITDVRFQNEAQWVRTWGTLARIERPSLVSTDDHVSENEVDDVRPHFTVLNDGTLDVLHQTADLLALHLTDEKGGVLVAQRVSGV